MLAVLGLAPTLLAAEKHRGVSWVAGPEIGAKELDVLVWHHVSWIVQTPFGWQSAADSPEVKLATSGRIFWGERDEGIETTTRLARERGIKTLLKPHIWLRGGGWRGEIGMKSETDWNAWFASYRVFIVHYAKLAERLGIEALAIGTELHKTAVERPDDWRRLIKLIRTVYGGELTYSANWYQEFEEVPFWTDLDYIGIQAYFPLTTKPRPALAEIEAGWTRHLATIAAVHKKTGRPVLFTEIGYKSTPDTTFEPWTWPERSGKKTVDLATQANAYQAFFNVVWDQPWFAGAYFWKWHPTLEPVSPSQADNILFTPQGKPAQAVLSKHYGLSRDAGKRP